MRKDVKAINKAYIQVLKEDTRKEYINAQKVGEPLIDQNNISNNDTIYLGNGTYLYEDKSSRDLFICSIGNTRVNADNSMSLNDYIKYDDRVKVTPEVLKQAAHEISIRHDGFDH